MEHASLHSIGTEQLAVDTGSSLQRSCGIVAPGAMWNATLPSALPFSAYFVNYNGQYDGYLMGDRLVADNTVPVACFICCSISSRYEFLKARGGGAGVAAFCQVSIMRLDGLVKRIN